VSVTYTVGGGRTIHGQQTVTCGRPTDRTKQQFDTSGKNEVTSLGFSELVFHKMGNVFKALEIA